MKPTTLLTTGLAICFLTSGCGTHEVRRDPNNALIGRGAEYYLPRTVLVTTVPVIKTIKSPGRFHFFSEPLLGREPSIGAWNVSYRVGDELALEVAGVKDPTQRFVSIHPSGPFKTFAQTYKWNNEGVLTHGDAVVEDKTVEFVVSTIEAGAKVGSALIKPAALEAKVLIVNTPAVEALLNYLSKVQPNLSPELDVVVLDFGLRFLMGKVSSAELKAEEAAAKMAAWQKFTAQGGDAYREIISATKAAKKIEELSDTLNRASDLAGREKIEKSLDAELAQFIGSKSEVTWVGQFRYDLPDRVPASGVELFSVTNGEGFKWPKTENIRTEMPEIKPSRDFLLARADIPTKAPWQRALKALLSEELHEKPEAISVNLKWDSVEPSSSARWRGLLTQQRKHGWHYRIPADSLVTVTVAGSTKLRRRLQVAQHGCVAFLPASSGGQKVTSNIDLDPVTGALVGVTHGGTAFDPGLVNRVGSAASEVITAQKAAEKARAEANDPLAKLERRKNLLQLKKDIRALEGDGTEQ